MASTKKKKRSALTGELGRLKHKAQRLRDRIFKSK